LPSSLLPSFRDNDGKMINSSSQASSSFVDIRAVTRTFGHVTAVDAVSLAIAEGTFFSLLGPSGCGKTTLMRMIAGFEWPDSGAIHIDGQPMGTLTPNKRPVNMMFQNYALFPHLSVRNNIAFGLKQMKLSGADVARRTDTMLSLVQLDGLADRMPHQLSGGQKQRVALARALAREPAVLLLDEPLGALDKTLRKDTQAQLKRIQRELGTTFIVVTHDQEEAMALSDRIAVMQAGRIVQVGAPFDLYQQPANCFVAGFLGAINAIPVQVVSRTGTQAVVHHADCARTMTLPLDPAAAGDVRLVIRPENLRLSISADALAEYTLAITVIDRTHLGATSAYNVKTSNGTMLNVTMPALHGGPDFAPGETAWLGFGTHDARLLPP
jgi:putrescine transport system ATP-binding protein